MKILTAAEMAEADRRTVEQNIPAATLMENAGISVARFCLSRYRFARRIAVLCGKGNNGGDGMVAGRALAASGCGVRVVLLGRADEVKGDAATALQRLRDEAPGVLLLQALDEAEFQSAARGLMEWSDPADLTAERHGGIRNRDGRRRAAARGVDLVVDAVTGTGFKPPLRGMAACARDWLAGISAPVVAVDLPSGWDADSIEQQAEGAFRADAVVTFTAPKRAHVLGHLARPSTGAWAFGPVVVADIGSPAAAVMSQAGMHWAGTAKALAEAPRGVNSNKGKFGHVLVVGGSRGTAGAPSMASLAGLRAGAGLVTAAIPAGVADLVANAAMELMVSPLTEGQEGAVALAGLGADGIGAVIESKKITVVAIGPGLSTRGEASEFSRQLVANVKVPMVVDADALNAFAGNAELLKAAARERVLVLTPHPGEMGRLAGLTVPQVEADRIGLARRFATENGLILVLKGWRTLIAHPDGTIAVNTTGNPAMAKGGSGDILTGIVAAMLAQYPHDPGAAVEAAVFLHGLAGDFAARRMDEHAVLATDTVRHLSDAFRYRVRDRDGLVWICGMRGRR